jgi:hypothetical protein
VSLVMANDVIGEIGHSADITTDRPLSTRTQNTANWP